MAIERVGHVVLKMRDLEEAKRFYGDVLGMTVVQENPDFGVFFRFSDYHHDIAIFKVSEHADAPKRDQVGLAHIALVADSFETVKAMYRRLKEHGVTKIGATDHGMTKSIYFTDPDGNGIEIYSEVPEYDYRTLGLGGAANRSLDMEALAATV